MKDSGCFPFRRFRLTFPQVCIIRCVTLPLGNSHCHWSFWQLCMLPSCLICTSLVADSGPPSCPAYHLLTYLCCLLPDGLTLHGWGFRVRDPLSVPIFSQVCGFGPFPHLSMACFFIFLPEWIIIFFHRIKAWNNDETSFSAFPLDHAFHGQSRNSFISPQFWVPPIVI